MLSRHRLTNQSGFTLIEVLVVMGIIAVLFALSTINLGQSQSDVNVQTTVDSMVADIKSQQLLAMSGGVGSTSSQQPQGVYVQPNQYTLYAGSTFNSIDGNNFVVDAPQNVSFSSTLSGGKLLFNPGDGSVNGFASGNNTITITTSGKSETITINRFGSVTIN